MDHKHLFSNFGILPRQKEHCVSAASDSYNPVVPPVYIGVSFLLSWVYLLFYARSAGIEAAAPISLMRFGYTLSAVLMVMTWW